MSSASQFSDAAIRARAQEIAKRSGGRQPDPLAGHDPVVITRPAVSVAPAIERAGRWLNEAHLNRGVYADAWERTREDERERCRLDAGYLLREVAKWRAREPKAFAEVMDELVRGGTA